MPMMDYFRMYTSMQWDSKRRYKLSNEILYMSLNNIQYATIERPQSINQPEPGTPFSYKSINSNYADRWDRRSFSERSFRSICPTPCSTKCANSNSTVFTYTITQPPLFSRSTEEITPIYCQAFNKSREQLETVPPPVIPSCTNICCSRNFTANWAPYVTGRAPSYSGGIEQKQPVYPTKTMSLKDRLIWHCRNRTMKKCI